MNNRFDDPAVAEFLGLLTALTADFIPHPEFPTFRIPLRPTPLDPICTHVGLDAEDAPHTISRYLFLLGWNSLPGYCSFWQLHALPLRSGERVYSVEDVGGRRIVALGPGGVGADGRFSRALFASNGKKFGTAILDSAPSRVATCLRGAILIDLFLDAFSSSPNAGGDAIDTLSRSCIRRWLKGTLTGCGKELRERKRLTQEETQQEFLALVEGMVSDFTPHPEERQVGVPRRFTPLFPLAKFLKRKLNPVLSSVSYQLFQFAWWSVPGSGNIQQIGAILLPDRSRVFWFYLEADDDEARQYFVAGTAGPFVTDLRFLQLLFDGNGKTFDVEVCGCPPCEILTPLKHSPELTDLFVSAYNGFPQAWESLDDYHSEDRLLDWQDPDDARELVHRHLRAVLR